MAAFVLTNNGDPADPAALHAAIQVGAVIIKTIAPGTCFGFEAALGDSVTVTPVMVAIPPE